MPPKRPQVGSMEKFTEVVKGKGRYSGSMLLSLL